MPWIMIGRNSYVSLNFGLGTEDVVENKVNRFKYTSALVVPSKRPTASVPNHLSNVFICYVLILVLLSSLIFVFCYL